MNKYNLDNSEVELLELIMEVIGINECRHEYDILDFWGTNNELTVSLSLYGNNLQYEHITSINKNGNYKKELYDFCKKCNLFTSNEEFNNSYHQW